MCDVLVRSGPTPPLRKLVIADFDDSQIDNIDISRAPIGDLAGLGERYPELEDVVLKGTGDVVLGDVRLPRARRFALRTSTLTRATLASILRAPWPHLEDLELWFGDPIAGYGQCRRRRAAAVALRAAANYARCGSNAMFSDGSCPSCSRGRARRGSSSSTRSARCRTRAPRWSQGAFPALRGSACSKRARPTGSRVCAGLSVDDGDRSSVRGATRRNPALRGGER
jgi:hypothetical protein